MILGHYPSLRKQQTDNLISVTLRPNIRNFNNYTSIKTPHYNPDLVIQLILKIACQQSEYRTKTIYFHSELLCPS